MSDSLEARFVEMFKQWAEAAREDWGFDALGQESHDEALARIPKTVQVWIARGVADGIVHPHGHKFTLEGLAGGKGPYDWFSNYKTAKKLGVNWEWFIHVAEYVRLFPIREHPGVRLEWEDGLMDLAIYQDDRLLVCIETKERPDQLRELLSALKEHEGTVDLTEDDRHNDPLRKAKYIVKHRPRFFVGVAAGLQESYRVEYPEGLAFRLIPDSLPPL